MQQIRFDDIPALRQAISEEFGPWGPQVEVTQAMINRFADLTADHQWIHVDVERARNGPFGGPVAHGLLTLALMPKIRPPQDFQVVGEGSRVHYGCESFRFLAPVPAGGTLRAHSRLRQVREHARGTLLTSELVVYVVGNERPSLVYNGMLLYQP
jgi:acyl dehydratase